MSNNQGPVDRSAGSSVGGSIESSADSSIDSPASNTEQNQALDSLGIVVGEIAHDFNNILSLIFGYVEMALSEIPEGERARSDLEHVLAAGDRAKELVSRILTYSNRAKLKKERIDIITPVKRAIKHVEDRIPPGVELESSIATESCFIQGNETELFQIITNLCNNSLQAMPASGGKIALSLQTIDKDSAFLRDHAAMPKQSYALLTVKDTGAGMELSTLEKIYTPFFTTSRAEDKSGLRAGLGLTTVYNIVTSQNGFIFVNSAPGEGTTFEICLPVMTEAAHVPQQPVSKPRKTSEKRVLFVDDEPAITEMAGHILAHSGYRAT